MFFYVLPSYSAQPFHIIILIETEHRINQIFVSAFGFDFLLAKNSVIFKFIKFSANYRDACCKKFGAQRVGTSTGLKSPDTHLSLTLTANAPMIEELPEGIGGAGATRLLAVDSVQRVGEEEEEGHAQPYQTRYRAAATNIRQPADKRGVPFFIDNLI